MVDVVVSHCALLFLCSDTKGKDSTAQERAGPTPIRRTCGRLAHTHVRGDGQGLDDSWRVTRRDVFVARSIGARVPG